MKLLIKQYKKKYFATLLLTIMLFNFTNFNNQIYVYADESSTPSDWAINEVNEAIDNELVDLTLQTNYKTPIKRSEYVQLAMNILKKMGKDYNIGQTSIFLDIMTHPNRELILKAYEAGVVSGYTDGTFKPNANITRQEIAALVYKLTNAILEKKQEFPNIQYNYTDKEMITGWALPYVNFCYKENIMKGNGSIDAPRINPLGTATREEAILLMYRLYQKYSVAIINESPQVLVTYVDANGKEYAIKQDTIVFSSNFNNELATQISQMANDLELIVTSLDDNSLDFGLVDGSSGYIMTYGMSPKYYEFGYIGESLDNEVELTHFISLVKAYLPYDDLEVMIKESVDSYKKTNQKTKTKTDERLQIQILEESDSNSKSLIKLVLYYQ